jgi:hypothetical protein
MTAQQRFKIEIDVVEGIPDGLRIIEKSNRVVKGIYCPKGRFPYVKDRHEFDTSGVYLLLGEDPQSVLPLIYIGETDSIRTRLGDHLKWDFWNQCLAFTRQGKRLNKAEIKYLEARLCQLARGNGRCKMENKTLPDPPDLPEVECAILDEFLGDMRSLMPVLGISIFETAEQVFSDDDLFHIQAKECQATGYRTTDGFAVKAGSLVRKEHTPSMDRHLHGMREILLEAGILEESGEQYRFTRDHEFTSPSASACFVTGTAVSGPEYWKNDQGVSLKELQQREAQL